MDWSDERYVRFYTRDTATWKLIRWEGQLVLVHLMKKVDRAGVMDFGAEGPVEAIVAVSEIPMEIVEVGLARLVEKQTVEITEQKIIIPKFLEAQESPQSDKARAREYRARRRDVALRFGEDGPPLPSRNVTVAPPSRPSSGYPSSRNVTVENEGPSQNVMRGLTPTVTNRDGTVTNRDDPSRNQSKSSLCTVPYRTVPISSDPTGEATAKDLTGNQDQNATELQQQQNGKRSEKIPCPVDLWERMPEPTKATMDTFPIPRDAQEYMCRGFAARYAGRLEQERTLHEWVSSAVRAMQADWNDPNKRPPVLLPKPKALKFRSWDE